MIRLRPSGVDEVLIKRVQDWYEPGPGVFIAPQALFNPALLFTTGVNGTWYDPSDTTTLFQDAAGTTPVTAVEQPVGLMLDKSKGLVLGPELVSDPGFDNPLSWTTSTGWAITGGKAVATAAASGSVTTAEISVVSGRRYKCTYTISDYFSGSFALKIGGALGVVRTANGTYTEYISTPATNSLVELQVRTVGGSTLAVDNISVRELPGNHAFNSSGNSANFPVLSARYNLLTKTEDFSDAVWVKTNATVTTNAAAAPNGEQTADLVTTTAANTVQAINSTAAFYGGAQHTLSFYVRSNGWRWIQLRTSLTLSGSFANLDVIDGVKGTESGLTSSIQPIASGWFRVSITVTTAAASGDWALNFVSASNSGRNANVTGDGTSGIYIWGADLRVANDALNQPAYQRVNTATDYDTVGFKPYLRFNGTNQWLQTNSIDFTYGDKMFVSAGVRKLSDATLGITSEIGTGSGAGRLYLAATNGGPNYLAQFAGSTPQITIVTGAVYPAPITNVISGIGDISGDQALLRVNGTQAASSTADQGTGNYGSYPLYLGARAGSSLWFNGRLYQLVVAGKQASAAEIISTETYLNQKTGAF